MNIGSNNPRGELVDKLPPTSAEEQDALLEEHPIRSKEFMLVTSEILRVATLALHAINKRWPCCNFVGVSRVGKSRASSYITAAIKSSFRDVLVFRRNSLSGESKNATVFSEMMSAMSLDERDLKTAVDARVRAARSLDVRARATGAHHVVLVADEANNLTMNQFRMLADISNEMELGLTFIGFGMPNLLERRNALLATDSGYLVSRFLNLMVEIAGIRSETDLREFMSLYDEPSQLEYPAGSRWPISRFFFPGAWLQGWRLGNEAGTLWRLFESRVVEGKRRVGFQISTECVAIAIKSVLIDNRHFKFTTTPISELDWQYGVAQSQFQPSIGWSAKSSENLRTTLQTLEDFGLAPPDLSS